MSNKLSKIFNRGKELAYLLYELQRGKTKIVVAEYLYNLEKENKRMKMSIYSARAANSTMDEIREIIDCPVGYNIVEAIKKIKIGTDNE